MRRELLSDICCPTCGGALDVTETGSNGDSILEGMLLCAACSSAYPIRGGIPHLLSKDALETKIEEMRGWTNLWRKKGMYDHSPPEDSFQLPYVGRMWTDVARLFDIALQEMNLRGYETVLDLGAGQGWASRYFAERGCRAIAVDLVDDEWFGLGRSWAIMKHAAVYFEPMLADGEALPFFPERFDIAFLCGTLHHFEKFDVVLREIFRVLRPGGLLIAAGEPSIPVFLGESTAQAVLEETEVGITERRPKTFEYWWALKRAGFKNIRLDTYESYDGSPSAIRSWVTSLKRHLCQVVRPGFKPLVWLIFGLILILPHGWAGRLVLQMYGGNLIVRAVRPSQ